MRQILIIILLLLVLSTTAFAQDESYLSWSASQAENVGKSTRLSGQIGKSFDFRGIHTDRAVNYKLRVTWLTPEVIRASARIEQLRNRLSDQQTRELVAEAEAAGDTVFMIEIDPREGSGVIPLDWRVILQPKDLRIGSEGAISGIKAPELRKVKALAGVARRDYDYDLFWVIVPLVNKDKSRVFPADLAQLQIFVGIYNSEGKLSWTIPESIRERTMVLSKK